MGRPKNPLISRKGVVAAALAVIDDEGLDKLSLKKLAAVLDVHESSIYYHYRYKNDILADVLRSVLAQFVSKDDHARDWKTYLLDAAPRYYQALAEHPGIVRVLVDQVPRSFGLEFENQTANVLVEAGFPVEYVIPIREQLEALVIGALQFASIDLFVEVPDALPTLNRVAAEARGVTSQQRFHLALQAYVDGLDVQLTRWRAAPPAPRPPLRPRPHRLSDS